MAKILVIDDEELFCNFLARHLKEKGHEVTCAFTLRKGLLQADGGGYDLVYLDVYLPDGNGLTEINRIRNARSRPEVIIMTGSGDPDGAELAIKSGAWDYIEKGSSTSSLILPMVRALQYRKMASARQMAFALKCGDIVGTSPKMQLCYSQIAQAARSDASVLIQGETGTGKELIALALHSNSPRTDGNFVIVDCASLSETLIENMLFGHARGAYTGADSVHEGLIRQADGGTLFLDEIGELPASIQKSFLRVLEEHRFRPLGASRESSSDFRLIAATNRDLDQMVQAGQFRSDLLYRVRSFQIDLPPLRERMEDIAELSFYHIAKICKRYHMPTIKISPELLDMFKVYSWPGNIRELVNTLERAVAVAEGESTLLPHHLPENVRIQAARALISRGGTPKSPPENAGEPQEKLLKWAAFRRQATAATERQYLHTLLQISGNDPKTAVMLSGLSRSRLYEMLKKHRMTFPS